MPKITKLCLELSKLCLENYRSGFFFSGHGVYLDYRYRKAEVKGELNPENNMA